MMDYKKRMNNELEELNTKIDAISLVLRTNKFNLSDYQLNLLLLQYNAMLSYSSILKMRIDNEK